MINSDAVRMTHPVQPTIPQPVERVTAEPQPVRNAQARPAPDARPIAAAGALLRDAARKFEAHLADIDPAPYTAEGLARQIALFNESPAAAEIDEAVALAAQREADAEAHVAEIIQSLQPKGDTADELRAGRAWSRVQRHLDSAPDDKVAEVARRLVADADPTELGVLLEEVPAYMASKNQGADWLEQVVAEKVPALADAHRKLKLARQARPQVVFDAERLRSRITGTAAPQAYSPVPFLDLGKYDPDA